MRAAQRAVVVAAHPGVAARLDRASRGCVGSQAPPRLRCTLRAIQYSWNQPTSKASHSGGSTSGEGATVSALPASSRSNAASQRSVALRLSMSASESRSRPAWRREAERRAGMVRMRQAGRGERNKPAAG